MNELDLNRLRRMQERMRPMTEQEIADMQRRQAPLMMHDQDRMRGDAGMRNIWTYDMDESYWIPQVPKLTFWQKLVKFFK